MTLDDVYAEAMHDYYNDPPDDDRREDARREAWDDAHPADMRCDECGAEWWGNWTRATRWQPAEPRNDTCPECGS